MTIHLALRTDDTNRLTVSLDGQPLAGPISLADLPALPASLLGVALAEQARRPRRAVSKPSGR